MGWTSTQILHNRAFYKESTMLIECVDFYTSMNIRYGGIYEINTESKKITRTMSCVNEK